MNRDGHPPLKRPTPGQLAAYLDGELDASAHAAVAAWLATRPADAAEIEGQRRLLRLWDAHPPESPPPAAWDAALARLHSKTSATTPALPRRRGLGWWAAGIAAAAVAATLLIRAFPPAPSGPGAPVPPPEEPWAVADDGDVRIVSMAFVGFDADAEARRLVVGRPPIPGPVFLVSQEEVTVLQMASHPREEGRVPHLEEGAVPMIVAPAYAPSER
jgi:hypothetical protein